MGLWESVANLPADIVNALLDAVKGLLIGFVQPLLDVAKNFIVANPDPQNYSQYWQLVVSVLSLFYLVLFVFVGLKFIIGSVDEVQRQQAKEWFKKNLFLLIFINASLLIYSLILELGSGLALAFWQSGFETLFSVENLSAANIFLVLIFAFVVLIALITLMLRYLIVLIGIMLFPIGFFLYFIPPVQTYGKIILNILGTVIFLQAFDALAILAGMLLLDELGNQTALQLLGPTMGFILVTVVNIVGTAIAVLVSLKQANVSVNVTQIVQQVLPPQKSPQTSLGDF